MKVHTRLKPIWRVFFIFLFWVSVTGCPITETGSGATAIIVNNSSYDLHLRLTFEEDVSFICKMGSNSIHNDDYIHIGKGQNIQLDFFGGYSDTAPDINYGIKTVIFSDLHSDGTVPIAAINNNNLFAVTGREKHPQGGETVYYRLVITDALLL
jgi:hypothetical protein